MPSSRGSSKPRDWTQVSYIAGRFFTIEPPGKPMNTEVGSLSLLQGIFRTQESNRTGQADSFSSCLVFRNSTLIYLGELYYHSLPLSGHFQTRFLCPSVLGSFQNDFFDYCLPSLLSLIFLKPLTQVLFFFFCFLSNFPSVYLFIRRFLNFVFQPFCNVLHFVSIF